jgi:DNA-binding XRE family transcriptional regulator
MKLNIGFTVPLPSSGQESKARANLTFGQLFKLLRKRAKSSKSEFAKNFGVTKKLVQEIESDRYDFTEPQYDDIAQQITDCFELDPEWVEFVRNQQKQRKLSHDNTQATSEI